MWITKGKKTYLMETFYRSMRKQYDIMMDGDQPITGQWNYDKENRKKLPKEHVPITPLLFEKDVAELQKMLQKEGIETIGTVDPKAFIWPTNREESLHLLDFFVENCLALFGTYQDAMIPKHWSLYHSRLSFSINTKTDLQAEMEYFIRLKLVTKTELTWCEKGFEVGFEEFLLQQSNKISYKDISSILIQTNVYSNSDN